MTQWTQVNIGATLTMKNDKFIGIGDFETSVYAGQTSTEVWASAVVQLYTEDVKIFNSIGNI